MQEWITLKGLGADDTYQAFLRMLDEVEQANKAGVTARDFAKSKGIQSTLTDQQAAFLDRNRIKMLSEDADKLWGSKDNLMNTATTPGRGGVSPVGRAFQKHASNPSRAGSFVGEVSGNAAKNTDQGAKYITDILYNPQSTYTIRTTKSFGEVLDVRLPDGTGARWSADGKYS